jgi:hypothetical protein
VRQAREELPNLGGERKCLPSRAACSHSTGRVECANDRAYSIARTGVTPTPALMSATGPSPDCRRNVPRGELTSRKSPTRTWSLHRHPLRRSVRSSR